MTDKKMSFLPDDYVEQRVDQRTNVICLTLFVVVLAGVVGAYVVTSRQRNEVRQQQARINDSFAEAARRIEQLDKLRDQKTTMLQKAQVTASLLERVPRTFLLADLINRMPETMSLFELQVSTQQVKKTLVRRDRSALSNKRLADKGKEDAEKENVIAAPPTQVALVLVGVAPTDVQVAQYMASLQQSDLLDDISLVFSEQSRIHDTSVRRFRIEMMLSAAADVRQIDPLTKPREIDGNPMKVKDPLENLAIISPDSGDESEGEAFSEEGGADTSVSGEGGAFTNLFQKLTGPSGGTER